MQKENKKEQSPQVIPRQQQVKTRERHTIQQAQMQTRNKYQKQNTPTQNHPTGFIQQTSKKKKKAVKTAKRRQQKSDKLKVNRNK